MTRSEFLQRTAQLACGSCAAVILARTATAAETAPTSAPKPTPLDEALKKAQYENQFVNNWLTDLFAAIDTELDPAAQMKLIEACGRGCYERHAFKQEIAAAGKGDVDRLVAAYAKNFGIHREGNFVHITYGGGKCYCPAARNRPTRPNDLQCECTRATHQALWQAAMGRPYKIELLETVRRGGQKCHLRVTLV
ncbi:hypothetical protein [Opitutus sp. ER46]|uniref:hypothetical protein n=1 Tax=Opitutus sp. ER46 TaxID=2161864 RepID=UPI000D3087BA|nr:hypothetical protein [Opitutus sp. ER46]PTX94422.1 hypothetical protein DB354_11775 [Opitutus sp. ER46]